MKTWYSSFCVVIVSLLMIVLFIIGLQNLSTYLKLIPWSLIGITFISLIGVWFLVDCVYVFTKYGFKSFPIWDRWIEFFKLLGKFFGDFKNNMIILVVILSIFVCLVLFIGCNTTWQTVRINFDKAVSYDKVHLTYQNKIDELIKENTDLKIDNDKKDEIIQSKDDQLFFFDTENKKLRVENDRLKPKGAKKNFR